MHRCFVLPFLIGVLIVACAAQSQPAPQTETLQDLVAKFTPEQKQQFDLAVQAHKAHKYADELTALKALLAQLPGNVLLSKFATEAALNSGQTAFALTTIKPIAQADPSGWQATALLVRACAESGDTTCRDSAMQHMSELHGLGAAPPNMREYQVEQITVGGKVLHIFTALVPWGPYQTYAAGDVNDGNGQRIMTITLESADGDQSLFAQQHPKEAAQGLRQFSLDSYLETGLNSAGNRTQTHYTYQFFTGQPSYTEVRQAFLDIVNGKRKPISSRSGLVIP